MNALPQIDAISALALAVFRLNGALLHWGDRRVATLGLSSARWQMLGALALADSPLSAPQVGAAMGVSRQGALKQLGVLQGLGLVQVDPNPAHRRSPLYCLTPHGRKCYEQADALWRDQVAQLARQISATQARQATEVLQHIEHVLGSATADLEDVT